MGRLYAYRPGGPNVGEHPKFSGGSLSAGTRARPYLSPIPQKSWNHPRVQAIVDERDEMGYNVLCCQARTWSAEVAELADALRSGRSGHGSCGFKSRPRHCQLSIALRGGAEAARQAHNLEVVGSNPTPATFFEVTGTV